MYYKYLPPERITYLKDELLRFTQPGDLNDPFECLPQLPNFKDFESTLKQLGQIFWKGSKSAEEYIQNNITADWLEFFFYDAYKKTNNTIGILSLSKNWNNSLMWAHYTNSHRGFCVGFNEKSDYFKDYLSKDKTTSRNTLDVVYSKERVKIPSKLSEKKLFFEPYITKSVDWRYEDEIRVIATLNGASKFIKNTPFDIFLFNVPHNAITEIILGKNISKIDEDTIRTFGLNKNIKIYKSKISDTAFDLERYINHYYS